MFMICERDSPPDTLPKVRSAPKAVIRSTAPGCRDASNSERQFHAT